MNNQLLNDFGTRIRVNPFVQGPIGPRESDPVFLKFRDDYILFFDAALICYSIFNSAQFDLWNIPVKNDSVIMNFAFIFVIYPENKVI